MKETMYTLPMVGVMWKIDTMYTSATSVRVLVIMQMIVMAHNNAPNVEKATD